MLLAVQGVTRAQRTGPRTASTCAANRRTIAVAAYFRSSTASGATAWFSPARSRRPAPRGT